MKNQLDVAKALDTFYTISEQGDKTEDGHFFEGVYAQSDYDGYTVNMTDKISHLTIFFHNKYELEGPDKAALERFMTKLEHIAKQTLRN